MSSLRSSILILIDAFSHPDCRATAELFVPSLGELALYDILLPEPWTEQHPVRLVTARTILFAALANFMTNPKEAFNRVRKACGGLNQVRLHRWLQCLPHSAQQLLADP